MKIVFKCNNNELTKNRAANKFDSRLLVVKNQDKFLHNDVQLIII
jgi:hypothetical protein